MQGRFFVVWFSAFLARRMNSPEDHSSQRFLADQDRSANMGTALFTLSLAITLFSADDSSTLIKEEEKAYQNENFQRWWGTELVWKYDDLPIKGGVGKSRIPWSGHDYPDSAGGTMGVLRKYDRAFHDGRLLATDFEQKDTTTLKERTMVRGPIFGLLRFPVERTPGWHGHCNGWTAASIRHPEPQNKVTRNGVVFTPADIKGLLAEIYMYNQSEFLGGVDDAINPGTFHAIIANWLGRGSHPVGMETALGREVFNYPIYAYASSFAKRSDTKIEVKMNVAYTLSTNREHDRSQHMHRIKYFHYQLNLNEQGEIIGGHYYGDSERLDMLWVPLHPVAAGKEGNEKGNPHVDVDEVLSIWRESVSEESRKAWLNIDPLPEDAALEVEEEPTRMPLVVEETGAEETPVEETGAEESSEDEVQGDGPGRS